MGFSNLNFIDDNYANNINKAIQTEKKNKVVIFEGTLPLYNIDLLGEYINENYSTETDEGDLLGNYVLINGNMEWRDGPVTTAARQGAVLCIDEIDYGAQNLASLQRVLEGKPFMLKKKGELIVPAPGFTVFATANTKGKGSDDGRYMFTNVLNEAFLERFPNTYEQQWPPVNIERKIMKKELESAGRADDDFADKLVTWADAIRKTFADGG